MELINLALRSEYSFKQTFGFAKELPSLGKTAIGIADINNTFGHAPLEKACNKAGIKPIYGVRLTVMLKPLEKVRGMSGPTYIFLAKNVDGLQEIYRLVNKAYDNFYYFARVGILDVCKLSDNVIVIAESFEVDERVDYIGLSHVTPIGVREHNLPKVAINNNFYTKVEDKPIYECIAGTRKGAFGYNNLFNSQTYPQHILNAEEHFHYFKDEEAIENTHVIADQCSVVLPKASMVRFKKKSNLEYLCKIGAKKRKIDLSDSEYSERLQRELKLIKDKGYEDYFFIVADMIVKAKKKMLVGPSRGSSAGSLVCYLLSITEVDPIVHGLLFERFIDINRFDLPDIDIDFPDKQRKKVIAQLAKDYGDEKVGHISTIARLMPKSAIGEFAMALDIPAYETDAVKGAIIERSGGDARAAMCIQDTFESTEVGRDFIEKYPSMKNVGKVEGHARHSGIHAAGIIVCNDPIADYAGINSRGDKLINEDDETEDNITRGNCLMLDKHDAEYLGLLKIDVLGLRTLSILEEAAKLAGLPIDHYYDLPLDDEGAFKIFNDQRLNGIFQFEGYALQAITKQMAVEHFDDIVAITSLARPGPLHSGGTNMFISRRTGEKPVEYLSQDEAVIRNTKETYGVIAFQEQLMTIGREYGGLSWEDVSELRKAASKSLGEEFFNKYKDNFLSGTRKRNIPDKEAINVWENMVTFGSWAFNKSHAVSYGLISYWTAYMKAHHPLEFAVANLNNARSDDSAIKILRDAVEVDGLEYVPVDADLSSIEWTVKDGKLIGGLVNIHGIGVATARKIISSRNNSSSLTPGIIKKLIDPVTVFDILSPCKHHWGILFDKYTDYGLDKPPITIGEIDGKDDYMFIGRLVDRNLRDLNEYQSVVKRGGTIIENDTLFLNMTVEDDTDSIICTINRYKYEAMGKHIAETGTVGESWYLIRGIIKDKWRRIDVTAITNLNEVIGLKGARK